MARRGRRSAGRRNTTAEVAAVALNTAAAAVSVRGAPLGGPVAAATPARPVWAAAEAAQARPLLLQDGGWERWWPRRWQQWGRW